MNEYEKLLRKAAAEIRKAELPGWGNACEFGADEIARLEARVSELEEARAAHWRALNR